MNSPTVEQKTTERDPRRDPRTCDEISRRGYGRRVVYVTITGEVIYDVVDSNGDQHSCSLAAWRRWARHAEVKPGNPLLGTKLTINSGHDLLGQTTRLTNRFIHFYRERNPRDKNATAPYDKLIEILLELGLADALRSPEGEERLYQVLEKHVKKGR